MRILMLDNSLAHLHHQHTTAEVILLDWMLDYPSSPLYPNPVLFGMARSSHLEIVSV